MFDDNGITLVSLLLTLNRQISAGEYSRSWTLPRNPVAILRIIRLAPTNDLSMNGKAAKVSYNFTDVRETNPKYLYLLFDKSFLLKASKELLQYLSIIKQLV